ncbi:ribosomal protein S30 [Rhizobium sp. BK650]|uniref:hypothetical protein n=1 Tax=Rhizobium sp. BK650 TaxID=2586990 RepID=UPI0016182E4A|nr:hypothetical protein [Rhizobium sp. BK650]MBB3660208.1 ribosomal protein S30 [Rhizobium sp. BK650]
MDDRSQMAFSPLKQIKNSSSRKKNLRFAENRVDKITQLLVSQTAVVRARRANCASADTDKSLLARICDRRRRAMDYLLRVQAFC